MGNKKKLVRFAQTKTFSNVFEPTMEDIKDRPYELKGKWGEKHFKNDHPIVLELGCGKGEYSMSLARMYPEKNFVGVDIKGARIWYGASEALEKGQTNVAFLRTRIEFIESFFAPGEVDEIWITFPDPQPKKARKRLTAPMFIDRYQKFLKPGGLIHLKTDSFPLYEYTLEEAQNLNWNILENTANLYEEKMEELNPTTQQILSIKTLYEGIFSAKGFKICYLKWTL